MHFYKEKRLNALLEYCKEPRARDEMMKLISDKLRSKNQKFFRI